MMLFNQENFNDLILNNQVIQFFSEPLSLKSGRLSHWYCNWRNVTNDAFLLDQLTDFILAFIKSEKIPADGIFGVPEGATKTAVIATYKLAKSSKDFKKGSHVIAMGRGKPKEHGDLKDAHFIGLPYGNTVVLEDTTTTGLSMFTCIDTLLNANVNVTAALCLFDRRQFGNGRRSVKQAFQNKYQLRLPFHAMSNALEILPLAIQKQKPRTTIVAAIKKEFEEFGEHIALEI